MINPSDDPKTESVFITRGAPNLEVDSRTARILRRGGYSALGLGLLGGTLTGLALDLGAMGFFFGYVVFGAVGKVIGLAYGIMFPPRGIRK